MNITNEIVRRKAAEATMKTYDEQLMLTAYDQLRPSQRVFVDVFCATDSPIKAIMEAQPGITKQVANVRAHEMLRNNLVQAAIADKMRKAAEKYEITLERTVAEIAKIAYFNIDDVMFINSRGRLEFREGVTREQMAAVAGFDVKQIGAGENAEMVVVAKFHDKNSALDKAMKYLGAYQNADMNVTINNNVDNRSVTVNMSDAEAAEMYAKSLED